eukprot:4234112-Prymnesium_polylepis.1
MTYSSVARAGDATLGREVGGGRRAAHTRRGLWTEGGALCASRLRRLHSMAREKKRKREREASSESDDERDGACSSEDDSENEEEDLFTAVAEGNLEMLKQLHADGHTDLQVGDEEQGDRPFGVACRFGHLEMAQWIEQQGIPMDAQNHIGDTPLHEASLHGHLAVVEWLLSKLPASATAVATIDDMLPISYAVLHGHTLVLEKLAAAGSDLMAVNAQGHGLVHLACSEGQLDVARKLKELGVPCTTTDKLGRSPLHIAAGASHLTTARWLAESCGLDIDTPDANGATPLHFAAAADDLPTA